MKRLIAGIPLGAGIAVGAIHLLQKFVSSYGQTFDAQDATMLLLVSIALILLFRDVEA